MPVIGYFTYEREGDDTDKYNFIPTPFLVQESMIMAEKRSLQMTHYNGPILKKELGVDKIANLC